MHLHINVFQLICLWHKCIENIRNEDILDLNVQLSVDLPHVQWVFLLAHFILLFVLSFLSILSPSVALKKGEDTRNTGIFFPKDPLQGIL